MAVPGRWPDGAVGEGRFLHDAYFVREDARAALRTPVMVEDVADHGVNILVTGRPA